MLGGLIALERFHGINGRGRCLASAHLPENLRVAVLVSLRRQVSGDFRRDAESLVFQGGGEAGKIGGKPADNAEVRTERKNGEACTGRNFAEILDDLLSDEGLILRLRVEKIEQ